MIILLILVYKSSSVVIMVDLGNYVEVLNIFKSDFSFILDGLSLGILIPVIVVGCLVQLYSVYYMESDPSKIRFFFYLNLFSFFMILLVLADNLLVIF